RDTHRHSPGLRRPVSRRRDRADAAGGAQYGTRSDESPGVHRLREVRTATGRSDRQPCTWSGAPWNVHNDGDRARSGRALTADLEETFMLKHVAMIFCLAPAILVAQNTVAGDWLLTEDVYGNQLYQRLTLKVDGSTLSGTLGRRSITDGQVNGDAIQFRLTNDEATEEFTGTIAADGISGTMVRTSKDQPNPFKTSW